MAEKVPIYIMPSGPKISLDPPPAPAPAAAKRPASIGADQNGKRARQAFRPPADHNNSNNDTVISAPPLLYDALPAGVDPRRDLQPVPPRFKTIASPLYGPFAGIVRIKNWPYTLQQVQRPDGVAFRPNARGEPERVFRDTTHFPPVWLQTQIDRQVKALTDPILDFMRMVAGDSKNDAERDFLAADKGRSAVAGEFQQRAGTSPFSFPDALLQSTVVAKGLASYSRENLLKKASEYIATQRGRTNDRDEQIKASSELENKQLFLEFAAIFVRAIREYISGSGAPMLRGVTEEQADSFAPPRGARPGGSMGLQSEADLVFNEEELARILYVNEVDPREEVIGRYKTAFQEMTVNPGYNAQREQYTPLRNPQPETVDRQLWLRKVGFVPQLAADGTDTQRLLGTDDQSRRFLDKSAVFNDARTYYLRQLNQPMPDPPADAEAILSNAATPLPPGLDNLLRFEDLAARESDEVDFRELSRTKLYNTFYQLYLERKLAWWRREADACNVMLQHLDDSRHLIPPETYTHIRIEWVELTRRANDMHSRIFVAARKKLAPGAREDEKAYQMLLDMFEENVPTAAVPALPGVPGAAAGAGQPRRRLVVPDLNKVLLWDSLYNKGRILESIKEAEEEQQKRFSATSDREWVGKIENLGWAFMQDQFVAALRAAIYDVQTVCGKGWVYYLDLMTHENVRKPFADLVSAHLVKSRNDSGTRPVTQAQYHRNDVKIKMLKELFKQLSKSPLNGMLYFAGVQNLAHIEERRQTERQRESYMQRTGEYYSDMYGSAAGVAADEFTFGRGHSVPLAPSAKVPYRVAAQQQAGRGVQAQFSVLQRNDVHMTGEERRRLEQTQLEYVHFM